MAQRDTKSTRKESAGMNERPSSIKFQTSLSQPAPSTHPHPQKSNPRRHLTLPVPLINTYPQSLAERYVAFRSQITINPNEQQDISPETPSSITGTSINLLQSPMSHAERMNKWHQEQTNKIYKKQKHRYSYGTPPSSSVTSPTSLGFAFPPGMYFPPSTQLNFPLSSQRNNIQSSMPSIRTIKKDHLIERSKTNESRDKIKLFSAV